MNRAPNYSVIPTLEKGEMKKKISYLTISNSQSKHLCKNCFGPSMLQTALFLRILPYSVATLRFHLHWGEKKVLAYPFSLFLIDLT